MKLLVCENYLIRVFVVFLCFFILQTILDIYIEDPTPYKEKIISYIIQMLRFNIPAQFGWGGVSQMLKLSRKPKTNGVSNH